MTNCDICGQPWINGQGLFGGHGDGGRSGAKIGYIRHYNCHVEKYGRMVSMSDHVRSHAIAEASKPMKQPITTKGKHNYSPNAGREFSVLARIREMGKTRIKIECPFCHGTFWAFIWSISGRGKKCPNCGSMHTSFGDAYPIEGNEDL